MDTGESGYLLKTAFLANMTYKIVQNNTGDREMSVIKIACKG